ncbi:hypothetical protein ABID82_007314 [Methylobacterium sp. PvP062]|jgi:hypothetical protein|uniref:Uncharacterized protein n=1 Tax=Methylobacterium radiotolerans TaxID=31998 RepID=A0ABV2NP91_9HYPH|nr:MULTISPECIES: hypothetical protein [unclassified Methylobacterium]MBP2494673.1 hypothetical protein [Methylobacterium sp. PvP105]MBP2494977.1 hypothetical protein [Methylobacterium sp. PvP105]MBP2505152.1 hypothetical protein [Methylobacterium sp. PvP109]MBP2505456.1 hypothetical protein [Methylobacterium sp. PvP109]
MAALDRNRLTELTPSLLSMFGSREAALVEYIGLMGELSGLAASVDLDEGERLIAQGCELVRQAITRAAAQGSSAS